MKKIILLFLISTLAFSQSDAERIIIRQSTNEVLEKQIKDKYQEYFKTQKRLIDQFKLSFPNTKPQRIIDGVPYYYSTDNLGSILTLRANSMYPGGALGLNVTGSGVTVGVWDGGKVRNTHQEFTGRLTLGDAASTLSAHGTHVTGTILAQGVNPTRKGLAYQASGITYDWDDDTLEMIDFASSGNLVSNHSYGNIVTNLQNKEFGKYNTQSVEIDDIMNTFPYYQIVKSAGNDRSTTTISQVNLKGGYDLLTGYSTAKNIITVAAVEEVDPYTGPDSVFMSSFSNYGPTDDGRIKPDIAAKGVSVFSTNSTSDTGYFNLSGTSMASPAITGLIALLQKHYNNLNPGSYMKSASVRGLLCHSAREAGVNPGPDYEFGWGLADGYNAAQVISQKGTTAILDERTILNSGSYTKSFTINSVQNVNVVIAWTDPTGTINPSNDNDNRSPRLKNNLDLKVLKDGTTYYPWRLNPDFPTDAAVNDFDNNVDNIERVEIFNATPGTYTIQVSHKGSLQGGSQDYTLIATSTNGLTLASDNFVADNNFFVYPSPANETISYSNPNSYAINSISIADISGKQVLYFGENAITDTINVTNLQSGVYFVTFTTGNSTTVKKFIKN